MNKYLKLILPHAIALIVMAIAACFYFSPELSNKTLGQSDVKQAGGTQVEIKKYSAQEGREVLWTNGMFAGMPTFQVYNSGGNTFNYLGDRIYILYLMGRGVSSPIGLLFATFLGMYLLLVTMRSNWLLSLLGALIYGMSTTHMILIEAGHVNKLLVIALLPPTLAGVLMIYRGKYLRGAAVTALFTSLQISANHPQITYYFFILLAIYGIFALVEAFRNGEIKNFMIGSAIAIAAGLLGVVPNIVKLWTTSEYVSESIRGKSDLKPLEGQKDRAEDGLTKDYAFDAWSLGKMESFTLLIPNFMGGDASKNLAMDESGRVSNPAYAALQRTKDPQVQESLYMASSSYWGAQSFVSGAWYYGAVIIFLYFFGFFSLRGSLKWWSLVSLALILMIAWGSNFKALNYTLFDHFPLFNKFRDPKMIIGIGHIIVVAIGILGLQRMIGNEMTAEEKKKALISAFSTVGGLILFALLYGMMSTLEGPADASIAGQFPEFVRQLQEDRAGLLRSDALRSLGFVLAAAAVLWFAIKQNFNQVAVIVSLIVLASLDIISVNKRYLTNDKFADASKSKKEFVNERLVDKQIMADKELSYRVADFSSGNNPFSYAGTSYFHKSVGGYHAAKLMIFQDVVERYLGNPNNSLHLYGMLNTKYLIVPGAQNQPQAMQLPEQCGNAWFVKDVKIVQNANEEMDSLKNLKPKINAVIQQKFAKSIEGLIIKNDTLDYIRLEKYIPDHMMYRYAAKSEQLAVFSEVYYPEAKGLKVYIDGKLADGALMKANYLLRAVRVPSGEHTIEMKFEPESYYKGQTYSRIGAILLTLLFGAALFFYFKNDDEIQESINQQNSL